MAPVAAAAAAEAAASTAHHHHHPAVAVPIIECLLKNEVRETNEAACLAAHRSTNCFLLPIPDELLTDTLPRPPQLHRPQQVQAHRLLLAAAATLLACDPCRIYPIRLLVAWAGILPSPAA